jgi:hypothetical protein
MNPDFAQIAATIYRQSQEIQASINSPNATLESVQDPGNAEEAKALPVVKEVWAVHSLPPKFLIDGTVEWDVSVRMISRDEPSIILCGLTWKKAKAFLLSYFMKVILKHLSEPAISLAGFLWAGFLIDLNDHDVLLKSSF